ncbi:hypothetical protein GF327_08705 [Candidatus Woesearchaeota archaeon]|nr:hypothetical protein [Candidatus Woesearchaeota archaeon]
MASCPKCGYDCIENEIALICPNCDYVSMKKINWKGKKIKCPKCESDARIYKHKNPGKSFVCDKCNTIGRFFDEKKIHSKTIRKDSKIGKKITWLFEIPCKDWKKRSEIEATKCKNCDLREVCEAHIKEIERFSEKNNVEIYVHKHFIEIIHE